MKFTQRELAEIALKIYAKPLNAALKRLSPDRQTTFIGTLLKNLYSEESYRILSFFPKRVDGTPVKGTDRSFEDTAIILQGPVITRDDFTLNTVRMYRQYYNEVHIIVSTWKDTEEAAVQALQEAGAEALLNEYPQVNPDGNLNLQLTTSLAGVQRAKERNLRFAMKTRTDQRCYNPCALSLLQGIYEKGKLILPGGIVNSFYSREFYLSDFFAFGEVEDLALLYSCRFDTEKEVQARNQAKQQESFKKYKEWVMRADQDCRTPRPEGTEDAVTKYACSEITLAYQYFLKKGQPERYQTVKEAYDAFLREQVVIVDADSLGFYWLKYKYEILQPSYFQREGKLDAAKWHGLKESFELNLNEERGSLE